MSYERPRELQGFVNELGGGRPSGGRAFVSLANAEISLRGVLEHGEVKANLRPAPWFYGLQEGGKVHRQRCGLLQGHVAVDNRPRYQQPLGGVAFRKAHSQVLHVWIQKSRLYSIR